MPLGWVMTLSGSRHRDTTRIDPKSSAHQRFFALALGRDIERAASLRPTSRARRTLGADVGERPWGVRSVGEVRLGGGASPA
jgi:hypothetical protein